MLARLPIIILNKMRQLCKYVWIHISFPKMNSRKKKFCQSPAAWQKCLYNCSQALKENDFSSIWDGLRQQTNDRHKTPSALWFMSGFMNGICCVLCVCIAFEMNRKLCSVCGIVLQMLFALFGMFMCLMFGQLLHFTFVNKFIHMEIVCEFFCTFLVHSALFMLRCRLHDGTA